MPSDGGRALMYSLLLGLSFLVDIFWWIWR